MTTNNEMNTSTNGSGKQKQSEVVPALLESDLEEKVDDLQSELWDLESKMEELSQIVNGWKEHLHRQEFRLDQLDIRLAQLQSEQNRRYSKELK